VQQTLGATQIPECKHGVMQYKEGVSAKGPYSGYVCSGPRGSQCPAKWDKK